MVRITKLKVINAIWIYDSVDGLYVNNGIRKHLLEFISVAHTRISEILHNTHIYRVGNALPDTSIITLISIDNGIWNITHVKPNQPIVKTQLNNIRNIVAPIPIVEHTPPPVPPPTRTPIVNTNLVLFGVSGRIMYPRAIRLERTLRKRTETLAEFLRLFFTEWNNEKKTIYVDDKSVQTPEGKRRSLGDIFNLVKYYYPNVELKDVLTILYKTLPATVQGFRSASCGQINKRTFYYDAERPTELLNSNYTDEYGFKIRDYIAAL